MTATETEPSVWIGCLACYNAGRLVGQWVDAIEAGDTTEQDIHREMIDTGRAHVITDEGAAWVMVPADGPSPHEELWCMDHEGFGGMLTGECSPAEAQSMAEVLARVEDNAGPFAAYVENMGRDYAAQDWDAAVSSFEDDYCGEWDSEEDYAQDLAEDCGLVNEDASWPNSYIDWERATRDLFMGDNWSADAGGGSVWVFRRS